MKRKEAESENESLAKFFLLKALIMRRVLKIRMRKSIVKQIPKTASKKQKKTSIIKS